MDLQNSSGAGLPKRFLLFLAALEENPQSIQTQTLLGLSYYGSGQFPDAVKYLKVVAAAEPSNTQLHQLLAQSCLWAKNNDCALKEFQQILAQNPDSAGAHVLMGEALDGLERTAEAIEEFKAAVKASPHEPGFHFGLGYLYRKAHQYDEAKVAFQAELEIDPTNAQAMAYLGDVELKQNDPEKALVWLNKAVQQKDDIRVAYMDLGTRCSMDRKQYPEALAAIQRAVKLDPDQPDMHFRLGRLYQAMGNASAAEQEFARFRTLHNKADEDLVKMLADAPPALHP